MSNSPADNQLGSRFQKVSEYMGEWLYGSAYVYSVDYRLDLFAACMAVSGTYAALISVHRAYTA
jgi:hypothetical protein